MDCPKCNAGMEAKRRKCIPFYSCLYCNGAWLPKDSLNSLYEQSSSPKSETHISELAQVSRNISDSIKCPSCSDTSLSIIVIHGIELDICGSCTGVFFDMGELESLRGELKTNGKEYGVAEHLAGEGLAWLILALFSGG